MSVVEAALRGGAISLLILLAVLLLRDARRIPAGLFGALFGLGVACYAVVSASMFANAWPLGLLPARFVAMGNPVVFCLFAAALFDDDFRPSWRHALAWLAVIAIGVSCIWIGTASARIGFCVIGLACNAIAAWYALAERSVDLVEARRRLRSVLIVAVALYSTLIIASEITFPNGSGGETLALGISGGVLALTLVFAVVLLSVNQNGSVIPVALVGPQPLPAAGRAAAAPTAFAERSTSDEDTRLLAALRRLMEHDRVYREEGLSIGGLAARLNIGEHALRRLINQRLGHRNFNAFLNGYRLDEVTSALADPAQEEVPILTIALDAGFQSLGPFNRAFKSRTGLTPSEFRRERLGRSDRLAAE